MDRRRFLQLSGSMAAAGLAPWASGDGFVAPAALRRTFPPPPRTTDPAGRRTGGPLDVSSPAAVPVEARQVSADVEAVHALLERRAEAHLGALQEFLRQPSISAQDVGVRECAELVVSYLQRLGCREARLLETDGHPVVWGVYDAGAPRTLVVYGMYDTQPIDEAERWMSPPLEANVVALPHLDGARAIVARGAVNTKGPLRAFLNALETIVEVTGGLPVNVVFTIEGEEEVGSRHLPQAIAQVQERLAAADGMYFAFPLQEPGGGVTQYLGNKGIVSMEISCTGAAWGGPTSTNVHGSYAAIVDSPVWRLLEALTTMTDDAGATVTIDGYLDAVAPPSAEDRRLIDALVERFDPEAWKRQLHVDRFTGRLAGRELIERYLYTTTWNIDGIRGGYIGEGFATILPHGATAKVDSRIVPDQRSADIVPLARAHLDRRGYDDVQIQPLSAYEWSKTSVEEPIVQAMLATYRERGIDPTVWPHLAGSAPFYLYTRPPVGLPMVMGGLGHGANQHSIDEYLVVESDGPIAGLPEIEKSYVDFLYRFAAL